MRNFLLVISLALTFINCSSWKNELNQEGEIEVAIKNAIVDFSNTSSLAKKDKVFNISFKEYNSGVIGISIIGNINKIYFLYDSPQRRFQDQYFEYKGKLFCWFDEKKGKDPNITNKLLQYKVIEKVVVLTEDMGYTRDDSKKGINYYFCKNNLLIYEKEESSIALSKKVSGNLPCKK